MLQLVGFEVGTVTVNGVRIDLAQKGQGRPILFLHPGQGFWGATSALSGLSTLGRVIAPSHPGFSASELPATISTVDDLAYFYLDLIDLLDVRDLVIVGASFGGWIAAEIAVRCAHSISQLILVDALGIKVGGRECRDIADLHAVDDRELSELLYADPVRFGPTYKTLSDSDLIQIGRNAEAFTLFGWQPYMYNPKLLGRLRRIRVPTLVLWGAEDRVVQETYGRAFASAIPGAKFESIPSAGHLSYVERPDTFNSMVKDFLNQVRD